ncbi:hypothetical protein V8C86DRAFT_2465959 [Haematococcus lacustris]
MILELLRVAEVAGRILLAGFAVLCALAASSYAVSCAARQKKFIRTAGSTAIIEPFPTCACLEPAGRQPLPSLTSSSNACPSRPASEMNQNAVAVWQYSSISATQGDACNGAALSSWSEDECHQHQCNQHSFMQLFAAPSARAALPQPPVQLCCAQDLAGLPSLPLLPLQPAPKVKRGETEPAHHSAVHVLAQHSQQHVAIYHSRMPRQSLVITIPWAGPDALAPDAMRKVQASLQDNMHCPLLVTAATARGGCVKDTMHLAHDDGGRPWSG